MNIETTRFDVRNYLKDRDRQAGYLEAVLEDGDPTLIAAALGDVARARGVAEFARQAGLSREAVYKGFRPGGNPTLETLAKAVKVLGLRLALAPATDNR
jgi:probable addiction module antidote protein